MIITMGDKKISIALDVLRGVGLIQVDESAEVFGFIDTLDSLIATLIRVREQNK